MITAARCRKGYEMLEPDVVKVASPVLRRGRASNRSFLLGKVSRAVLRGLGAGNGFRLLGDSISKRKNPTPHPNHNNPSNSSTVNPAT